MRQDMANRFFGAWWGAFLGDAIAMPTHGYASEKLLRDDYGRISGLSAPKAFHPESVLTTLPRPQLPPEYDYLGNRRRVLWSKQNTHPHYGLEAGENTLSMFLAMHLAASIADAPGHKFDIPIWMERYQAIMTNPDACADTFIPSVHRRYFENLAAGKDPENNGCPDAHMSDVAMFIPIMFGALRDPNRIQMQLYRALKKFTIGESASNTAFFLAELLALMIKGSSLEESIYTKMTPDRHFCLAFPYRRWIKNNSDEQAVNATGRFAVLEEAMPLTMYLAIKYHGDLLKALLVNANIGGESPGRGAVLGMLIGAECGYDALPKQMLAELKYASEIEALSQIIYDAINAI